MKLNEYVASILTPACEMFGRELTDAEILKMTQIILHNLSRVPMDEIQRNKATEIAMANYREKLRNTVGKLTHIENDGEEIQYVNDYKNNLGSVSRKVYTVGEVSEGVNSLTKIDAYYFKKEEDINDLEKATKHCITTLDYLIPSGVRVCLQYEKDEYSSISKVGKILSAKFDFGSNIVKGDTYVEFDSPDGRIVAMTDDGMNLSDRYGKAINNYRENDEGLRNFLASEFYGLEDAIIALNSVDIKLREESGKQYRLGKKETE